MQIQTTFVTTEESNRALVKFCYPHDKRFWVRLCIYVLVLAYYLWHLPGILAAEYLGFVRILYFAVLLWLIYCSYGTFIQAPKRLLQRLNRDIGKKSEYLFEDNGFRNETTQPTGYYHATYQVNYCIVNQVRESREYLFLYSDRIGSFQIDKRAMTADEALWLTDRLRKTVFDYKPL